VQQPRYTNGYMFIAEDDIDIDDNPQKQKGPHFPGLSKDKISKGFQSLRGIIRCPSLESTVAL
jgi:hypothetical protein